MINMAYAVVGAIFMVLMGLFAFLKGGSREKAGAGVYLFAWFSSLIAQESVGFRGLPLSMFVIDAVTLLALIAIAWRAPQSWPTWAAGLQLIAVTGHLTILANAQVPISSIYTAMNLIGYLIILCIAVGTFWTWQERKIAAEYERTVR